jgi:hypothetical protein
MTSEVVVLNKKGLVVAADSAVTTGLSTGNHPRYSKAANKIFDISVHGNVAVTIFGAADIDRVPWELALKAYRTSQANTPKLPKIDDYVQALKTFLQSNPRLFPKTVLDSLLRARLGEAMIHVLQEANRLAPGFLDDAKSVPDRIALWNQGCNDLRQKYASVNVHGALSAAAYQNALQNSATFVADVDNELNSSPLRPVIAVAQDLAHLAIDALYKEPTAFIGYTGLVTAGYGDEEIFPQYQCIHVHGHIGAELLVDVPGYMGTSYAKHEITHSDGAWIQAFAQSSMIDVFTDGFGYSLRNIIREKSQAKFNALVDELRAAGIPIPAAVSDPIVNNVRTAFMREWQTENYDVNFAPLRTVLSGLSIQEMVHLAENLLTLESLKERVTSPTESVGGPIDVAAITKAEGLVWIRRKHFFEPELNHRYFSRMNGQA